MAGSKTTQFTEYPLARSLQGIVNLAVTEAAGQLRTPETLTAIKSRIISLIREEITGHTQVYIARVTPPTLAEDGVTPLRGTIKVVIGEEDFHYEHDLVEPGSQG